MADVKISALPAASTPVANADVLPLVQGSATNRVTVDQLTVGRVLTYSAANVSSYIAIGGNPAAAGNIRLSPLGSMQWRKADGTTGQGAFVSLDAADSLTYSAPAWHRFYVGATETFSVRSTAVVLGTATVNANVPGALVVGTNPAQSGAIRLPNNQWITARNAANTADMPMLMTTSGNVTQVNASASVQLTLNGSAIGTFTGALASLTTPLAIGANPAANGAIRLPNNQAITARNAANSADVEMMAVTTGDVIRIGPTGTVRFQAFDVTTGSLAMADGKNITIGSGIGSIIGGSAAKIGFYGTAPVAKPTGWAAPTGTATRSTYATSTATVTQLAERLKALIDDLTALGLIGP